MNKVFAFHGADHKCGTSMICQSVAERIAMEFPQKNILVVHTEGRRGTDYATGVGESLDRIKPYLAEGVLDGDEVFVKSKWKDNLFMVAGSGQLDSAHSYHPDMSDFFLASMRVRFDLILCDSGSEIEHGLALGSLFSSDGIYIVMVPTESAIKRYEWLAPLYQKLKLNLAGYVINRFDLDSPYNKPYIKDRLAIREDLIVTVHDSAQGKQAETEGHTLLNYHDGNYSKDITIVANKVLSSAGLDMIETRKKRLWKGLK